ncbi:MAG: hypothetical protein RIA64_01640 [Rhodospirillales bacterium]
MGNAAVIAIIGVFVAIGILGVLFYVSTLAKNVYEIKIQMKDDLAYELARMKEYVEREMVQRQKWITRDVAGASDDKFGSLDTAITELRSEVSQELVQLNDKVRKLAALQQAMAARKSQAQAGARQEPDMDSVFKVDKPGREASG